jgi:hypothetical protein
LKRFRMIEVLLFLFFAVSWQSAVYTACPPCMRRLLWRSTLFNLLPANVLWFIVVLPWNLALWLESRAAGHSEEMRQLLQQERDRLVALRAASEGTAIGAAFAGRNGGGEAIQRLPGN